MNGSTHATHFAIVAGGAIGTLLRFAIAHLPTVRVEGAGLSLPMGTLAANLLGAAALGWVAGLLGDRRTDPRWAPLTGGLLGATTTFALFAVETGALLEQHPLLGMGWALGSVTAGLALVRLTRRWGSTRPQRAAQ